MKNYIVILLLLSFATLFYLKANDFITIGSDDANIYFTYAKNIVETGEITYNIGGERVEGYTSTLWLFIITILYLLTSDFEILLIIINLLIVSFAVYYSIGAINKLLHQKLFFNYSSIFLLLFLIFYPGFIEWNIISLLETGLWTTIFTITFINIIINKSEKLNFLLIPLLVITRPESTLWILILISLIFITSYQQNRSIPKAIKKSIPFLLIFISTYILLSFFRYEYFGYLQANTYYAKVSTDKIHNFLQGIKYDVRFLISNIFQILIIGLVLKNLPKIIDYKNLNLSFLIPLIIIFTAYFIPLVTSGDHFNLFRFFQPYLIFFFLFFIKTEEVQNFLSKFQSYVSNKKVLVISVIPIVYSLLNIGNFYQLNALYQNGTSPIFQEMNIARDERISGNKLNLMFDINKPSIGVLTAGGIAYEYEGKIIDLLGLNNTEMAHANKLKYGVRGHASFDKNTFFALSPDIFFGWFVQDTINVKAIHEIDNFKEHFFNKVFKNLYFDEVFKSKYLPILIIDKKNKLYYNAYINKNSIEILKNNNLTYVLL